MVSGGGEDGAARRGAAGRGGAWRGGECDGAPRRSARHTRSSRHVVSPGVVGV